MKIKLIKIKLMKNNIKMKKKLIENLKKRIQI